MSDFLKKLERAIGLIEEVEAGEWSSAAVPKWQFRGLLGQHDFKFIAIPEEQWETVGTGLLKRIATTNESYPEYIDLVLHMARKFDNDTLQRVRRNYNNHSFIGQVKWEAKQVMLNRGQNMEIQY